MVKIQMQPVNRIVNEREDMDEVGRVKIQM